MVIVDASMSWILTKISPSGGYIKPTVVLSKPNVGVSITGACVVSNHDRVLMVLGVSVCDNLAIPKAPILILPKEKPHIICKLIRFNSR